MIGRAAALPIPAFPILMLAGDGILVLDLRRDDDYDASDRMVAGAVRVRPASFHRHAHHLPRDRDLVFYCT
ncbi:MAG: hypothetical protein C4529_11830 [Deltaproteobacteria bacterium]|nr:MAG: hypothetical protein C4529_11830 [Deltaproteobacteria bacterium]